MIRALAVFVATAVASGALTFGLAALDVSPWPMLGLFLVVGLSLTAVRQAEPLLPAGLTLYACLFVTAFVVSLPESPSPRIHLARLAVTSLLLAISAVTFLFTIIRARDKSQALPWFFAAVAFGVFVAFISGDQGSAEPMRTFLHDFLPAQVADAIVIIVRKSIHVTYYGLMALCVYRFGKVVGARIPWAAVAYAGAHGAFDEYRQFSASKTRYGTPTDILFDVGGAVLLLFLVGAFKKGANRRAQME